MKQSMYKSFDELPLVLNAQAVAKVLGIAPSSAYELMHKKTSQPSKPVIVYWLKRNNSVNGLRKSQEVKNNGYA